VRLAQIVFRIKNVARGLPLMAKKVLADAVAAGREDFAE
jgi:hypothetical protein